MRRAAALPAVLLTIALTSALAAGSVYVSRQFIAGVRLTTGEVHLRPAVEASLWSALAAWDSAARTEQPIGTTVALDSVWVTRLREDLYLVVGQASRPQPPRLYRRSAILTTTYGGGPRPITERAFLELP